MSSNTPPIRPTDREEREKIHLPPIEPDKKIKEKFEKEVAETPHEGLFLLTWFTSFLKRLFNFFIFDGENAISRERRNIFKDLKELKDLFETLAREDKSSDPLFIQKLSEQWLVISHESHMLEKNGEIEASILKEIDGLKAALHAYRGGSEHPFTFYLERHVGATWFPVPFLEMLASLHTEAMSSGEASTLHQWIGLIEDILA